MNLSVAISKNYGLEYVLRKVDQQKKWCVQSYRSYCVGIEKLVVLVLASRLPGWL